MAFFNLSPFPSIAQLREAVRLAFSGKLDCCLSITLRANETTTTITDKRIGADSVILLMPTTTTATGVTKIVPAAGSAVITHSNTADTDKIFRIAILG